MCPEHQRGFFYESSSAMFSFFVAGISCCHAGHSSKKKDEWMKRRIAYEFAYFKARGVVSGEQLKRIVNDPAYDSLFLVHFSIRSNQVYISYSTASEGSNSIRVDAIRDALQAILKTHSLPDIDFLVSMHDALGEEVQCDVPLFVMAKQKGAFAQILIPDFDALRGAYQVLHKADITKDRLVSWKHRKNKMIWRGSTAQHAPKGYPVSWDLADPYCLSRVKLCAYSEQFPEVIDAKFTHFVQGAENVPYLARYRGDFISYEEQLKCKYQMLIDGNSCSYSASGWRFFSGSLVFKEDSEHVQWYYSELQPYKHYIPVTEGLGDLMDKLKWAHDHDDQARIIAKNARVFAASHITQELNRLYLYHTLLAYSKIYSSN